MRKICLVIGLTLICVGLVACSGKVYEGYYRAENIESTYGEGSDFTIEIKDEEFEMVTSDGELVLTYTGNCYQCGENQIVLDFVSCIYTNSQGEDVTKDIEDSQEDLYLEFDGKNLTNEDEELSFVKADK